MASFAFRVHTVNGPAEIRTELKRKDDEFVKTLKRQAEDIDTLLQYMSRQFVEMQNAYKEELDEIESAFLQVRTGGKGEVLDQCWRISASTPAPAPTSLTHVPSLSFMRQNASQERSDLLGGNRKELNELFEKRSKLEADFMERYLAAVESYQAQLDELRCEDAEAFHILKIRLETDIQNLEQHLEAMRATYQLNTEKLEYNYRVLVERDHENQVRPFCPATLPHRAHHTHAGHPRPSPGRTQACAACVACVRVRARRQATINQQKRKISKQRDILSSLKARYAETDRKYLEENMKLTDEYKRITEQFKDLQGKFRHFEQVDTRKHAEVSAGDGPVVLLVRARQMLRPSCSRTCPAARAPLSPERRCGP